MILYYIILFILGICFGSFSTVLIYRWHSGKGGILLGRSQCPHCSHTLSAGELLPIVSWVVQGGKCKSCRKNISNFYPLAELIMGLMFVWSGWIAHRFGYDYTYAMWWIFLLWAFITGIYILYDIRYMEIPDQVMVPGIMLTTLLILSGLVSDEWRIFFDIGTYQNFHTFLTDHISGAILLYSFFFLQILIPGATYLIREKQWRYARALLMSYFTFPFDTLRDFIVRKDQKNNDPELIIPSWIGGGDLRIALFIGLTLGTLHAIAAVIFAYLVGSIFSIPILIEKYLMKKSVQREIAFGPFLAIGWMLSLSFYGEIINYIELVIN